MIPREQFDGESLRRIRRTRGLTQKGLAEKAGCSRNIVNRAEIDSKCSERMTNRFAQVLGVPAHQLYRETINGKANGKLSGREERVLGIMRSSGDASRAIWHFALGVESLSSEGS